MNISDISDITDIKFVKDFIRMADDGFRQGWHERNGGNLSYRMKEEEVREILGSLGADTGEAGETGNQWLAIDGLTDTAGITVPGLAGEFFLITGSGKYFRNIILEPEAGLAVIEINKSGDGYRICRGLSEGGRPTSELPTHLMNHEVKKRVTGGRHRVIYHAHTSNVTALTFVLPLKDEIFTRELWEMAPECPIVFPDGIGVLDFMVPCGRAIAEQTCKLMESYDVAVWAHHGIFCAGEDFDSTFGLMHTVEKAAEILVKVLSMSPKKLQTITLQDLKELASDFNLSLPEKFLVMG